MSEKLNPEIPKWLEIAHAELGTKEIKGKKHEPQIVEYHQTTSLHAQDDETPWCSSFVNWCMKEAGYKGTYKANARSWLKWGYMISTPAFGCVAVLSRGNPKGWQGHVAFYVGQTKDHVLLLGGNQGDQVSIQKYPKSRVLGYRWP